jgi:enoyl-CoA hydratase/carnithine racemase
MAAELQSTSEGLTMVLTISNPEHRNALGPEIYAAGVEALNAAESSAEVRSVVIAGEGAVFSAGGNLQRLQANRQQPPEIQARSIEGLHNWIEAIRTFPKPVIAAVEGPAAGAGFSLALACDFIIAATNAVFVMAYSNIALSPDGGGQLEPVQSPAAAPGQRVADVRRAHRRRALASVGPRQSDHRPGSCPASGT